MRAGLLGFLILSVCAYSPTFLQITGKSTWTVAGFRPDRMYQFGPSLQRVQSTNLPSSEPFRPSAAGMGGLLGVGLGILCGWHHRMHSESFKARSSNGHGRPVALRALPVHASHEEDFDLCRVARGVPASRVPVWLFRQAGRHLPEYNEYKARRNKNFLELLNDPDDVAEVTMQPLRRYNVDAAILFSDILVVPEALGIEVDMPGGRGITVQNPLRSPTDLARLPEQSQAATASFVESKLPHVLGAIPRILNQMAKEGYASRPLIGFSAAPWTLFFYMVGGSSKRNTDAGEEWLNNNPESSKALLSLLTKVIVEYLSAQVRAGVHILQVFEAMGDFITADNFRKWALPCMEEIAKELRERHPSVPLMVFPRGASYSLPELQTAGYDVVTVDTGSNLGQVADTLRAEAARTGGRVASLQGNFDPKWLRPEQGGNKDVVRREVRRMMDSLGSNGPGLIANLGEGLDGRESPELVSIFVDAIHNCSSSVA